eukprot:scaffold10_cov257-Pinguiococcus_pyrenoidosus.AAC.22
MPDARCWRCPATGNENCVSTSCNLMASGNAENRRSLLQRTHSCGSIQDDTRAQDVCLKK